MEYLRNIPFSPKLAPVQSYVDLSLLKGVPGMGSFLIVFIKVYSIKNGNVRNLQKLNTYTIILDIRLRE